MGWAGFYGGILSEYARYGYGLTWGWNAPFHRGTLDWWANQYIIDIGLHSEYKLYH